MGRFNFSSDSELPAGNAQLMEYGSLVPTKKELDQVDPINVSMVCIILIIYDTCLDLIIASRLSVTPSCKVLMSL